MQYDDRDAINTIRNLPQWWSQIVTAAGTSTDFGVAKLVDAASEAATALGSPSPAGTVTPRHGLAALEQAYGPVHAELLAAPLDAARRAAVDLLLDTSLAVLRDLGRLAHTTTATQSGRVASINRSEGGAPKVAVDEVVIGERGLAGDRQRSRQHHGRPWQAVSLWSSDVIDALHKDGHPVRPGSAGENLTLAGLDWSRVGPGMIIAVGEVVLEGSMWAEPCRHIGHCFADGRWGRIHHDQGPVSRLYASVRHGGVVRLSDEVVVEPR